MSPTTANLLYLITIAAFILALRFLSSPRHARLGVQIGAAGMLWAVLVTFFKDEVVTGWWWTAAGIAIGSVVGVVGAIIVMGTPHPGLLMRILSFIAVVLASANVVGGFVVTDRMLEMFKKRPDEPQ